MQLREQAYDSETCFTAAELRAQGFAVPERIPDDAWIRRSAVQMSIVGVERLSGNRAAVHTRLLCSEPFRWGEAVFDPEEQGAPS